MLNKTPRLTKSFWSSVLIYCRAKDEIKSILMMVQRLIKGRAESLLRKTSLSGILKWENKHFIYLI